MTAVAAPAASWGVLLGAAPAAAVRLVAPQTWTAALGVGSDKNVHRQAAKSLFGGDWFDRKKDDGRADAALIGWWWLTKAVRKWKEGVSSPGASNCAARRAGGCPNGSSSSLGRRWGNWWAIRTPAELMPRCSTDTTPRRGALTPTATGMGAWRWTPLARRSPSHAPPIDVDYTQWCLTV